VHPNVSHCLQSEKIIEMGAQKDQHSSDSDEKGWKKPLLILFYAIAFTE